MKLLTILCLAAVATAAYSATAIKQIPASAPFTDDLRRPVKTWAERFPALKRAVEDGASRSKDEKIKAITNRGYLHYSHEVALQAIEGVEEQYYDGFVQYMLDVMEVPKGKVAEAIKEGVFEIVRFATNSDWYQHKATFSVGTMHTKHITLLGHRNQARNNYDFVVAEFKNTFQIAPDILVVKETKSALWGLYKSSTTRIEYIPPSLKKEDLEVLVNFFDMSALVRFAKMLDVHVPSQAAYVDPLSVIAVLSAGVKLWEGIANAFKTTITNTLLKEVVREGFDYYEQRSTVQLLEGLQEGAMIGRYADITKRLFELDDKTHVKVKDALWLGTVSDSGDIKSDEIVFNPDGQQIGTVRVFHVMIQNIGSAKYNVVVVNLAQKFRLAPNILYIQRAKSYAGGIYQKTDIVKEYMPRELTEKDLQMLVNFFYITTFKRLAKYLNIQIEKPDPQINTS